MIATKAWNCQYYSSINLLETSSFWCFWNYVFSFNEICSVLHQFTFKFPFFRWKWCCIFLSQLVTLAHLSAAPSCLVWSGQKSDKDLIAMGTEAGDVHVYSTSQSRLVITRKVSEKCRVRVARTPAVHGSTLAIASHNTTLSSVITGAKHPRCCLHFDTSWLLLFFRYNT